MPSALWTESSPHFGEAIARYADPTLTVSPVESAVSRVTQNLDTHSVRAIAQFTLKSTAAQPINYTLDEPTQSSVAVTFTTADGKLCGPNPLSRCNSDADCGGSPGSCQESLSETCAEFGNATTDEPGAFRSRQLLSITTCPTPPPGCSASGAFLDEAT
jgi:hypothetical protein